MFGSSLGLHQAVEKGTGVKKRVGTRPSHRIASARARAASTGRGRCTFVSGLLLHMWGSHQLFDSGNEPSLEKDETKHTGLEYS